MVFIVIRVINEEGGRQVEEEKKKSLTNIRKLLPCTKRGSSGSILSRSRSPICFENDRQ